jgi:hypothetical protein
MKPANGDILAEEARRSWLGLLQECRKKLQLEASRFSLDLCLAKVLDASLSVNMESDVEQFLGKYHFSETNLATLGVLGWLGLIRDGKRRLEQFGEGVGKLRKKKPDSFGISYLDCGRLLMGFALGIGTLGKAGSGEFMDLKEWIKSSLESFLKRKPANVKWQLLTQWTLGALESRIELRGQEIADTLVRAEPSDPSSCVSMLWAIERSLHDPAVHGEAIAKRKCDLIGRLPLLDMNAVDVLDCAMLEDAIVRLSAESARFLPERGMDYLVSVLTRFPQCLRKEKKNLQDEDDVQRVLWVMLRSQFDDLVDEEYLRRFGLKNYRLDIGIRSLRTIVEAKFVRPRADLGKLQDELLADIQGYLKSTDEFDKLILFIYDCSRRLHLDTQFVRDLEKIEGVQKVVIIQEVQLEKPAGKAKAGG